MKKLALVLAFLMCGCGLFGAKTLESRFGTVPGVERVSAENAARDAERYRAFIQVVECDTAQASAAVQLVLAQPRISSQLVDNLNALIHLRAVLTDLFLIDEVIRAHP